MQNRRSFIKKSGLMLVAGALPLSAFSIFRTRQGQAQNIVVTLYVNTSLVDKQNTATSCNFGQPEGVSNEEFTIDANFWEIPLPGKAFRLMRPKPIGFILSQSTTKAARISLVRMC